MAYYPRTTDGRWLQLLPYVTPARPAPPVGPSSTHTHLPVKHSQATPSPTLLSVPPSTLRVGKPKQWLRPAENTRGAKMSAGASRHHQLPLRRQEEEEEELPMPSAKRVRGACSALAKLGSSLCGGGGFYHTHRHQAHSQAPHCLPPSHLCLVP